MKEEQKTLAQQSSGLIVVQKLYSFMKRLYKPFNNFPKREWGIGGCVTEIRSSIASAIEHLSRGNAIKSKRIFHFSEADGHLHRLSVFLTFSRDNRFLSYRFFEELDKDLTSIKRMVSALIKSSK